LPQFRAGLASGDVLPGLAEPGRAGTWSGPGLPGPPGQGRASYGNSNNRRQDGSGDRQLRRGHCPVQRARRGRRERRVGDLSTPRPSCPPRPGGYGTDNRRAGERIFGQQSAGGFNRLSQQLSWFGRIVVAMRGRPPVPRAVRARFWDGVRSALSLREAAEAAGVHRHQAEAWFRKAGGVPANGPAAGGGRYLTLASPRS
jgi:hypothetical protein